MGSNGQGAGGDVDLWFDQVDLAGKGLVGVGGDGEG